MNGNKLDDFFDKLVTVVSNSGLIKPLLLSKRDKIQT